MVLGQRLLSAATTFVISANAQQGEVESGTRRKVKRLLSFQRYCHASRLLRGLVPHTAGSLHLLDDDYLGQAAVSEFAGLVQVCNLLLRIRCESLNGSEKSLVSVAAHAVKSRHLELRHLSLRSVNKW